MLKILGFIGVLTIVNIVNLFLLMYSTRKDLSAEVKAKLIAIYFVFTALLESYLIYSNILG